MNFQELCFVFLCAVGAYHVGKYLLGIKPKAVRKVVLNDNYIFGYVIKAHNACVMMPVETVEQAQHMINALNLHAVSHVGIKLNGRLMYELNAVGVLVPHIDVRV